MRDLNSARPKSTPRGITAKNINPGLRYTKILNIQRFAGVEVAHGAEGFARHIIFRNAYFIRPKGGLCRGPVPAEKVNGVSRGAGRFYLYYIMYKTRKRCISDDGGFGRCAFISIVYCSISLGVVRIRSADVAEIILMYGGLVRLRLSLLSPDYADSFVRCLLAFSIIENFYIGEF